MAAAGYSRFSLKFTRLWVQIFVGIVLVVHVCKAVENGTERTDICPEESTEDETDEERFRFECCANTSCPVGFFQVHNRSCNATGHLTNSSGIDDAWMGAVCELCHEDCVFAKSCSGPDPEHCVETKKGQRLKIIVGATVGGVVFIVLVILLVIVVCRRARSRNSKGRTSLDNSDREDGQYRYDGDDSDSVPKNADENGESLSKQISLNHDRVLRYTPDPTENIPQRPQAREDVKSGMYVNQRSVQLVQQLSKQGPSKPKHVTKGKKKKAQKKDPLYVNATKEELEIDMLPIAPAPPLPSGVSAPVESSLSKGPAYVAEDGDHTDSPQGQSALSSGLSGSGLMKGPGYQEGEDTGEADMKIPPLPFAVTSQPKGNAKKKHQKSTTPSTKAGILRGPAYKHGEEGLPDCEGTDGVPGLMKGPGYQAGEEHYVNQAVIGSAEKTQPAQRRQPKTTKSTRVYKGKAVDVHSSDSDKEDYEEVRPPGASPLYENFGFSS